MNAPNEKSIIFFVEDAHLEPAPRAELIGIIGIIVTLPHRLEKKSKLTLSQRVRFSSNNSTGLVPAAQ